MFSQEHVDQIDHIAKWHGLELTDEQLHVIAEHVGLSGITPGTFDWTSLLQTIVAILLSLLKPKPTP